MVLAQQWFGENTGSGETRGFQWLELVAEKFARQILRGRETVNGLLLPDPTLPILASGDALFLHQFLDDYSRKPGKFSEPMSTNTTTNGFIPLSTISSRLTPSKKKPSSSVLKYKKTLWKKPGKTAVSDRP